MDGIGGGATKRRFSAGRCSSSVCSAEFVKRLRYCDYLGKYFCECCHSYAEYCIPARILTRWDFRKYYVSNFSKWLLDSIWHQPIFNLLNIRHSRCAKAKELDKVRVSSCLLGEASPAAERVLPLQMDITPVTGNPTQKTLEGVGLLLSSGWSICLRTPGLHWLSPRHHVRFYIYA